MYKAEAISRRHRQHHQRQQQQQQQLLVNDDGTQEQRTTMKGSFQSSARIAAARDRQPRIGAPAAPASMMSDPRTKPYGVMNAIHTGTSTCDAIAMHACTIRDTWTQRSWPGRRLLPRVTPPVPLCCVASISCCSCAAVSAVRLP